jgi:fatty acid-binding protein DegV
MQLVKPNHVSRWLCFIFYTYKNEKVPELLIKSKRAPSRAFLKKQEKVNAKNGNLQALCVHLSSPLSAPP